MERPPGRCFYVDLDESCGRNKRPIRGDCQTEKGSQVRARPLSPHSILDAIDFAAKRVSGRNIAVSPSLLRPSLLIMCKCVHWVQFLQKPKRVAEPLELGLQVVVEGPGLNAGSQTPASAGAVCTLVLVLLLFYLL